MFCVGGGILEDLAAFTVDYARGLGAEYAEARFQRDIQETVILKNGFPEAVVLEEKKGIGVRVLVDGALGFASTDNLTRKDVKNASSRAFKMARASSRIMHEKVSMDDSSLGNIKVEVNQRIGFDSVDIGSKIGLLKETYKLAVGEAAERNVKIPACSMTIDTWMTEKLVVSSDGAYVYSIIPRAAFSILMTAFHPQKGSAQRFFDLGGSGGWEIVEGWRLQSLIKKEAETLSEILLSAGKSPSGKMDVILGPELIGLICHESSGHPGEADRILGREAAQAGETYLKKNSIGLRVGSPLVNVVDDPTLDGSFGFYLYDDEGVKARKRTLIKEGVINEFLHNRETASVFGVKSNGSARASAFDREPIVRMANTYLEPGDYSVDELLEDVKEGVYIKSFMEWNIDDRRFNQRYVGLEAYRILNGEIKERIRNPILEVTTTGLWSSVDAVGRDLEFQAAYCGKGDPMQGIPVWTGGPHVRLREVILGDDK
ncbi:TldD/PmbA family protein [Candidatus Bathyarchaeota archaeon]|nr:MAG: TldD/PmbA family protein [Candidatus Bathyarchaeota archaeon]